MKDILENLSLAYIEDGKHLIENWDDFRQCGFYEHATCVSFIKENFEEKESNCPPACFHNSIHQESITVRVLKRKFSENIFSTQNWTTLRFSYFII